MANKKDELVTDVEFVFSECVRFHSLMRSGRDGIESVLQSDWWYELPHPSGQGKMVCGRAAMQRLERLTTIAIAKSGLQRQVDLLNVRKQLSVIIVRKFLIEGRPVDIQQIERALSEAGRWALKSCTTITHFIPCHLMVAQQPLAFSIGPVNFLNQRAFRSVLAAIIKNDRRETKRSRFTLRDSVRYYTTFGWVAVVRVPDCDETTSKVVAEQAAIAALNCLHLLLGAGYTRRMVVGGPAISYDKRGGLWLSEGGKLRVMASYGGMGEVAFEDDWFALFDRDGHREALALCGVALEAAVDVRLNRPLSERFLDAALWFGEAVRERSPAAKVVKYATGLERMVMTEEKDDITSLLSERIAAICFEPSKSETRDLWRRDAQRLYSLRSKLVHGALSPTSDSIYEGVQLGAKIGQYALLSTQSAWGAEGLRAGGVTSRRLANWFERMVTQADHITSPETSQG